MTIDGLDANRMYFWDLTNVLKDYNYNDIPTLYYKYNEESNEDIHGLTIDQEFLNMIKGLKNGGRKKLHLFVNHEPVEPVPIEVVQLVLLLSQSPLEVDLNYFEEDVSQQPAQQPEQQPP